MTTFQRTNSGPLDEIDEELALLDGAPPRSEELRELDAWWRAQERVLPPDYGTPHPLHAGRSQQPSRARPAAAWIAATSAASASGARTARPMREWIAPTPPSTAPNRRPAAAASRQTTATTRTPVCFSSQTSVLSPCRA